MTRAHHVTHGRTAERIERIRRLITELQDRDMRREDIADLLKMSPSGARKYIADLRESGVMEIARYADGTANFLGYAEYRLALGADETRDYLANLATAPTSGRKAKVPEFTLAARDPSRHFHILADDTHYAIRVNREPAARDWCVAALFGAGPARMGARV
jgi:predicted transcriptional regulator